MLLYDDYYRHMTLADDDYYRHMTLADDDDYRHINLGANSCTLNALTFACVLFGALWLLWRWHVYYLVHSDCSGVCMCTIWCNLIALVLVCVLFVLMCTDDDYFYRDDYYNDWCVTMCTNVYGCVQIYTNVNSWRLLSPWRLLQWRYYCVLINTDAYWCVLIWTNVYWCVLMCTNVYWCVLMCTNVY